MQMKMLADLLSGLSHDNRGNSVVELALYLPFALLAFGGMFDFSQAVTQKLRAQQAVARTLEMASNLPVSAINPATLRAEAAAAANVPESSVTATVWVECNGIVSTSGSCPSSTELARYVSVTINHSYQLTLYPALSGMAGAGPIRFQVQGSLRIQ
jgi:Flp pilus assembly protein TadG